MVDLAHLTGDRQNVIEGKNERIDLFLFRFQDLKDERRRSQLSASRTILEKSTILILTSSKVVFSFFFRNFKF